MDTIYVVYKDYGRKGKGKPERSFIFRQLAELYVAEMFSPGNFDDYIIDRVEIELGNKESDAQALILAMEEHFFY
jgi:hypothetical protein